MPRSIEITAWLYERQHKALEKYLPETGVSSVADEAQRLILERYRQLVSAEEQDQIEKELQDQIAAEAKAAEDARRYAVVKIVTNGSARYFSSELLPDLYQNAIGIRRYLRAETVLDYSTFAEYYESLHCLEITPEEYDRCACLFGSIPNVTGIFVFDFDTATVSTLRSDTGEYSCYAMRDVSTAAYHALRKTSLAFWARNEHFYSLLGGKALPSEQKPEQEPEQDDSPELTM